jgi:cardiolipin synthase A/B
MSLQNIQNIQEKIFFNGNDYFASLLNDIDQATSSIDLETYIFEFDQLGVKIIKALIAAAKRQVKVNLLVDGAGTPQWNHKLIRELEQAKGQTRIFHPFPWRLWQWSHTEVKVPSLLLKLFYLFLKINSRNHRKVCLIDHKIVYIGSFNICQNHLDHTQQGDGWRDTGVRLAGINLDDLKQSFEAAWNHIPIQERIRQIFRHIYTNPIIRLNNTRHRRRILYKNLLSRMRNAEERIWITNAYFVPDNFLLKRLIEAANSGIDVRILLSRKSVVFFMPWASQYFYTSLLEAGVRIFEYIPSVLHAKTLIIDNWMTIGSSNLNHRSLLHDLEVDVNIKQPSSKMELANQFLNDLENSEEISLSAWTKRWQARPFLQRFIGKLSLYLKYWI